MNIISTLTERVQFTKEAYPRATYAATGGLSVLLVEYLARCLAWASIAVYVSIYDSDASLLWEVLSAPIYAIETGPIPVAYLAYHIVSDAEPGGFFETEVAYAMGGLTALSYMVAICAVIGSVYKISE